MTATIIHGKNTIKKPDNQLVTNSHDIIPINVGSQVANLYAM